MPLASIYRAHIKSYIFTCPDNIGQLIQIIGRVHRVGQKHAQKIWLLTNLVSYDNWLQAGAAAKFAAQMALAGES
jgi:hypothetical protein